MDTTGSGPQRFGLLRTPPRLGIEPNSPLISYWVLRKQAQEFVMLVSYNMPAQMSNEHDGKSLRVITSPELAAHSMWIDNWQRMLPVINCCANLVPPALKTSVLALANVSITLLPIERDLTKAAIFRTFIG
jgi:hypothetical protein